MNRAGAEQQRLRPSAAGTGCRSCTGRPPCSNPGTVVRRTGGTSSTCSIATRRSSGATARRTSARVAHRAEHDLGLGRRRHDVRRDAAVDQADRVVRAAEHGIGRQFDRRAARSRASISLSIADSPSSGNDECAARPLARQLEPEDPARREAEAVVGRLAVDQEPASRAARRVVRDLRAVAAALFADDEQQARRASSPSRRSRSAAATCAARMPFASHEPRPYSRSPSTRLGKNGGTQSKCVENTTAGVVRDRRRDDVEARVVDGLLDRRAIAAAPRR